MSLQCQAAFEHPTKALCKEPILQCPNMEKPYPLFTDASHYAFSGILIQGVESPEDLRPIAYTSGLFSDTQQRWSATEKKAFAVNQHVPKFNLYPSGGQNVYYAMITNY